MEQGRASGANDGRARGRSEAVALNRPWNATIADGLEPPPGHRVGGRLLVAVRDAALCQVVRGHLHRDPVAVHDFDAVAPKSSRHRREDGFSDIELDREHSGFELLDHLAHYFDCIFFWQFIPLSANQNRARHVLCRAPVPDSGLTSGFAATRRRSRDIRRPPRVRPSAALR